ncbi:ADP-ribosyltransferase [Vibrio sp. nBUS_14]|uniref:ADP-ribosyltransferase n=1 Tax=unclassified Vibrio TaxID=2614977 RepID=UPI003EBD46EA
MKKFIWVLCLSLLTSFSVQSEEFAEFKGRPLSHETQQQIADNLMDWATTHHVNAEKKMVPEEYSAIKNYGRVDHDVVNEYMRAGEPEGYLSEMFGRTLKSRVFHMRNVMNKLPNYKGTVYRGSSIKNTLLDKLNVGDILHEKAFLSTSTLPSVAKNFSSAGVYEGASAAQFKIELKSAGRAINAYTFKPDEAEILAKPNTYYRVEAIEKISPHKNYIKMREVKNPSRYLKAEPDIHIYDSFNGEEVSLRNRSSLYCL